MEIKKSNLTITGKIVLGTHVQQELEPSWVVDNKSVPGSPRTPGTIISGKHLVIVVGADCKTLGDDIVGNVDFGGLENVGEDFRVDNKTLRTGHVAGGRCCLQRTTADRHPKYTVPGFVPKNLALRIISGVAQLGTCPARTQRHVP